MPCYTDNENEFPQEEFFGPTFQFEVLMHRLEALELRLDGLADLVLSQLPEEGPEVPDRPEILSREVL